MVGMAPLDTRVQALLLGVASLRTLCALHVQPDAARPGSSSATRVPEWMPQDILGYYDEVQAHRARKALAAGAEAGARPKQAFDYARCHRSDSVARAKECLDSGKESVFEAVGVSFALPDRYLAAPRGDGGTDKNVVRMSRTDGRKCVVYAAGVGESWKFEKSMAKQGCQVHAFDCTADESGNPNRQKIEFHHWCLGSQDNASFAGNRYTDGRNLTFKSLSRTAAELNTPRIDIMKMDIEGFEYGVIESEILRGDRLPMQLAFELHTEEASTRFVPENNTRGKGYNEVNRLFLGLYDKGYRVISRQVNHADGACAEFVLVNVRLLQA